jgi:hypothetical protein
VHSIPFNARQIAGRFRRERGRITVEMGRALQTLIEAVEGGQYRARVRFLTPEEEGCCAWRSVRAEVSNVLGYSETAGESNENKDLSDPE